MYTLVLPYFFTLSYNPVSTQTRTVTTNYASPKSINKTVETLSPKEFTHYF